MSDQLSSDARELSATSSQLPIPKKLPSPSTKKIEFINAPVDRNSQENEAEPDLLDFESNQENAYSYSREYDSGDSSSSLHSKAMGLRDVSRDPRLRPSVSDTLKRFQGDHAKTRLHDELLNKSRFGGFKRDKTKEETIRITDADLDGDQDFFSEHNLESFMAATNPLLESIEKEEASVQIVRFKHADGIIFVDMRPEDVTLEELHDQICKNSKCIEEAGKKEEIKKLGVINSKISHTKNRLDTETQMKKDTSHAYLELNTYPLHVRYKVTQPTILNEIRERLNVKIYLEGRRLNDSYFFINFYGSEENVRVACEEVRLLMDHEVTDEAKETELRDLMRLLLCVGDITRPSINVRRHCVLVGLYPIQCIVLADELILIESRGLSRSDNEVLEKTAIQMKLAMMSAIPVIEFDRNKSIPDVSSVKHFQFETESDSLSSTQDRPSINRSTASKRTMRTLKTFDQVCFHAVLVTVCGLQRNAADALEAKSERLRKTFNSKTYVSIDDQKDMQVLKAQCARLMDTVSSHARALEKLIDDDIKMAFMNLDVMRKNSFMYRMTVDNKMTLSMTDKRVSEASHDIELLLYAYLLRYSKMESELKLQKSIISSTEQGQELQSLNVQTKVLVANTMITVLATVIGFCGYVTGAFGMNLDNTYWTWPDWTFNTVIGVTLALIIIFTKLSMVMLRHSGILPNERIFTVANLSRQSEPASRSDKDNSHISNMASLVAEIL